MRRSDQRTLVIDDRNNHFLKVIGADVAFAFASGAGAGILTSYTRTGDVKRR
jgi:hypothetical protein